jgi:siroheme synthase
VTGHVLEDESLDWRSLAGPRQTVVFYMGVAQLARIVAKLRAAGAPADLPAAIIERATLPDQRISRGSLATIADIASEANVAPPALLLVGEVAAFAAADALASVEGAAAVEGALA